MALTKSLVILAILSGVVFPLPLMAQEEVTRSNGKMPHVVPGWFVRMASPETKYYGPLDSFLIYEPRVSQGTGKFTGGIKYPCRKKDQSGSEKEQWQFCDM